MVSEDKPMITSELEARAAQEWIDYWKSTQTGAQSWIGNEQASRNIAKFRREIDEYRRRGVDSR
jgi:hypothetical protein